MSLGEKIQTLAQIADVIAKLNNANNIDVMALNNTVNVLAVDIFNLVNKDSTGAAFNRNVASVEVSPTGDKQTVNTKKETAPKSTSKKVTAADIVETKPEVKPEETKIEEPEVSLTDDDEASLVDDEPEVIDYEALRTECRGLINTAVDRVGKPAVVAILDYLHAKSLKDVKDANLPWLRTKLTAAK